ncbi:hypothetical protein [Microcoleus sp. CAWBG58]|uniref:hypothetical protein n=1 Tax=Microcoleus sp. CAWBG58 TaxID=2841651 RepID=UPI0025DF89DC|nr:hypothetical protein [Microcoleus sp. CAWBG58]
MPFPKVKSLMFRRQLLIAFVTLLMGSACATNSGRLHASTGQQNRRSIVPLTVKLRDGFSNDTVTIRVNGKEVYQKSGVTTDLTISFADRVEVPVEESTIQLEVAVQGGLRNTEEIRVQETAFVDVWIVEGKMDFRSSKQELPML